MHRLQIILIKSLDAKLLAVRRVTTDNKGRKTPGLDKQLYLTPERKSLLVKNLRIDGKAYPIRRVWIPKPGKSQKRPIPIIKDRAKQALLKLALEPEWEARFLDHDSYGFRPARSATDGIMALKNYTNIKGKDHRPKYVLDADIEGFYDNIEHEYLINKVSTLKQFQEQIRAWLKAGIFEGLELERNKYHTIPPNELGTPQAGIISPLLANIAIDGLGKYILTKIVDRNKYPMTDWKGNPLKGKKARLNSVGFIRYADNFVITHNDKKIMEKIKSLVKDWLKSNPKLHLNEEKTEIRKLTSGIDFLGYRFITTGGRKKKSLILKIYPSKKNQKKITKEVGDICRKYRNVSTYNLIQMLAPKIIGWGNYFRYGNSKKVFSNINYRMWGAIRRWVFKRAVKTSRKKLKLKYFPEGKKYAFCGRIYTGNWILNGKKKIKSGKIDTNFLPRMDWIATSVKYTKVKKSVSIFDGNKTYWANRQGKYMGLSTKATKLLRTQNKICAYCGNLIDPKDLVEVDHVIPKSQGGSSNYKNLQLLHKYCHEQKTFSN